MPGRLSEVRAQLLVAGDGAATASVAVTVPPPEGGPPTVLLAPAATLQLSEVPVMWSV